VRLGGIGCVIFEGRCEGELFEGILYENLGGDGFGATSDFNSCASSSSKISL